MADNGGSLSGLSAILGGAVILALVIFLLTGGDLGGTKKIEGDADLPQVTSPRAPAENTGSRR